MWEACSLFGCWCVFGDKILASHWTLFNVVLFHAGKCLSLYNMGLDWNAMEGREQKHQMIVKYAGNTTY